MWPEACEQESNFTLPLTHCTTAPAQGVEAVAIHGDKEQSERELSIDRFKSGEKDVLVATDVASKVRAREVATIGVTGSRWKVSAWMSRADGCGVQGARVRGCNHWSDWKSMERECLDVESRWTVGEWQSRGGGGQERLRRWSAALERVVQGEGGTVWA